ncbi:MAG TPA: hypothetical protein VMP01_13705 [Pirellulaceae bacterium]|nr:hypothetical protein [Pirellulaceae bacterium]
MAPSSPSPPAAKPTRRGWRYSLRTLLVFVTLAGVGLWYWYRVPYREEVIHPKGEALFFEGGQIHFATREVRRFRRVLRGDPIREGITEYFDKGGNRIGEETWREGKLHGTFVRWYRSGKVHEQGEYDLGAKTGVWERFDSAGNLVLRDRCEANWRHGETQWFAYGKVIRTVRYSRGEIMQIDGRAVDDPLGRAWRDGMIESEHTAKMLDLPAQVSFTDKPLYEVIEYVSVNYDERVVLDRRVFSNAGISEDSRVNLTVNRINAHLLLFLICDPHGLAATYRFGMIWITTKDSAKNWTDRTGVSQVLRSAPPDALQDSRERIAAAWLKPASFDFLDTPCSEIGRYLANAYRVPLECDEKLNSMLVTNSLRGISLQNALGALCDQHNLRIRWKDAQTLVIEPQQ